MSSQALSKVMRTESVMVLQVELDHNVSDSQHPISQKKYDFPVEFTYHKHKFLFIDKPSVDCKQLIMFHKNLENDKISVYERYHWHPSLKERINIDCNACLLGFVMDDSDETMAMLSLFDVSDSAEKMYETEMEISLCVLPKYQRKHLATDLVKLAWTLFADQSDECWIYVCNSRKSGIFWRKFRQWYAEVNFRLVHP